MQAREDLHRGFQRDRRRGDTVPRRTPETAPSPAPQRLRGQPRRSPPLTRSAAQATSRKIGTLRRCLCPFLAQPRLYFFFDFKNTFTSNNFTCLCGCSLKMLRSWKPSGVLSTHNVVWKRLRSFTPNGMLSTSIDSDGNFGPVTICTSHPAVDIYALAESGLIQRMRRGHPCRRERPSPVTGAPARSADAVPQCPAPCRPRLDHVW